MSPMSKLQAKAPNYSGSFEQNVTAKRPRDPPEGPAAVVWVAALTALGWGSQGSRGVRNITARGWDLLKLLLPGWRSHAGAWAFLFPQTGKSFLILFCCEGEVYS